jgi:hypothetical protein
MLMTINVSQYFYHEIKLKAYVEPALLLFSLHRYHT